MELDDLLEIAAAAPFGPLTLSYAADGENAWWINATLEDAPTIGVRMVRDLDSNAVRLERQVISDLPFQRWRTAIDSRPWVTDTAQIRTGGVHVRYWLHASDLGFNLLLAAISDIARLESLLGVSVSNAPARPPTPPTPIARTNIWQSVQSSEPVPAPPLPPLPPTPTPPAPPPPPPPPASVYEPVVSSSPQPLYTRAETPAPMPPPPPPIARPAPPDSEATVILGAKRPAVCKACGEVYSPEHSFCTSCGARLK
jgi:hypothetical protein